MHYASIDHDVLSGLLRQWMDDPAVLDLVGQTMQRVVCEGGEYTSIERGISLGCPLSPQAHDRSRVRYSRSRKKSCPTSASGSASLSVFNPIKSWSDSISFALSRTAPIYLATADEGFFESANTLPT